MLPCRVACARLRKALATHKAIAAGMIGVQSEAYSLQIARNLLLAVAQSCFDKQAQPLTRHGISAQYEHYAPVFKGLQEMAVHSELRNWNEALLWAELTRGQAIRRPDPLQPSHQVQSLAGIFAKQPAFALGVFKTLCPIYQRCRDA